MIQSIVRALREPLSAYARARLSIISRYLALIFLFLFLSGVPLPADRQVMILLALAALISNVIFHVLVVFTRRAVPLSYAISFADLAILSIAVHFTGMLNSPFIALIPILFFVVYFVEFKLRMLMIFVALALLFHVTSLALWISHPVDLAPWRPSDFPLYCFAIGLLHLYNMVFLLYYATMPDPLVEELSRQESRLALRARQAEMGSSLIMIAGQFQAPLASLSRSIALAARIARRLPGRRGPDLSSNVKHCREEARHMRDMLLNVAAYARNRHGKYSFAPCRVENLVSRAIQLVRIKHGRQHAHYSIDHSLRGPEMALCDEEAIYQVLINLLDNAIEARAPQRPLRLDLSLLRRGRMLNLIIRDNGRGIPDNELSRLFDLFMTSHTEGTGLGLPIVRQVLRDHGGDIAIQSVEGAGTTVTVSLPLAGRPSRVRSLVGRIGPRGARRRS